MIEILEQYGKAFLWSDGYRFTGVAVTMWLLVISLVVGFMLALPMSIARVSQKKALWMPVWLYTYIFRGTPLYVQLLVFYSGVYTLSVVREVDFLNLFFRSGFNCTVLALALNTCAYTTENGEVAIRIDLRYSCDT
jgi:histidine transport system permease protein